MPYERIIAFLTGPLSALIGAGSTALVHQTISHSAALSVATFALTSLATAAGHIKWLNNVPQWWNHITARSVTDSPTSDKPASDDPYAG